MWELVGNVGIGGNCGNLWELWELKRFRLFRRINKLKLKIRNNIYSDTKNNKIKKIEINPKKN